MKEAEEGSCTFEENEKCVSKAHPLFQSFRIWQQIVSLTFSGEIDSEYNQLTRERLEKLAYIAEHPGDFISTKKRVLAYSNIKSWLGALTETAQAFFDFITSEAAREVITAAGVVPAN